MPITKSDVLSLIQDAEERNLLIERSEDKEVVNNPLSYLRFDPFLGPFVRYQERVKEDPKFGFEEPGQVDRAKDIERAIVGGGTKLVKSIGEFITAGVDFTFDTNATKKLDEITNDFLNKHGDPKLTSSQIGEFVLQLGGGYKVAASMIANIGKLKNIKKLQADLLKKFPALTTGKYLAPTFQFSKKIGTGALSLGAADMLAMDSERETFVIEKTPEEGKTGRDLAIARLANKIKFGTEGAVIGGGIPLVGKGLSVGFRYGIWKPAKFTGKMGLRGLNFAVVNPLSKGLARVPYLEQGVGIVKNLPAKAFDKTGLPPFKQWNLFTVNDNIALRRFLKRSDNVLSALKSIGRQTPEQADVAFKGEKLIKERARTIEKLLDSLEARAYAMVKSQKKMYDTKTTSPASMEKYLGETMEYLRGQRSLEKIQAPLRPVAKEILKITDDLKKEFRDVLPKDSELLPNLLGNALRGYWRKSFGIFTNPNYSVPENSKVFKDAVNFVKKIKSLDVDDMVKEISKRDGISKKAAKEQVAKDMINNILRTAKTDNKDPIQILTRISKEQLDSDKFIATGKELPPEILKLLGDENNARSIILQTVSNLSTQTAYKRMFDRLGEVLSKPVRGAENIPGKGQQLFKTRREAELGLNVAKGDPSIVQVGEIGGLGLLRSSASKLYGSADRVNRLKSLRGPLDVIANIPIYKQVILYPKIAAQYGKTVLSPATQTRNFSSASFFVGNRGLLGNRASVTESFKMMVDDIFSVGKGKADEELKLIENIREGIKYGALDENIVAAELGAVLKAMNKKGIKSTDELTAILTKGTGGQALLSKMGGKASRVYAGGDNVWKWYAYNWYKSFLGDYAGKDLGKMKRWFREITGKELDLKQLGRKQLTTNAEKVEEAIKQASGWYVRNTMPTYSMVPDLIKAIRVTPFGNFVAFPAEMIRTSAKTLQVNMREMASSDVVMREMGYRGALGQFFALGGASIATKETFAALTGVSTALMNAYKAYVAPEFQRNANLIAVSKPENGVFKVVDLSTFFPYDAVTRPVQAAINKYHKQQIEPQSINRFLMDMFFSADGPIGELIAPFVNQSIALETITEVLSNKKKEGGQIYSELDGFPEIFNKSLAHIFRSAEPGAVTTGRQLYYGFQETLTPTGGTYDIGDVLIGLGSGIKPLRIDLKRSMDFILGDLTKIRTEAPKTSKLYRQDQTKREILEEFIKIQRNAWNEQRRIYKALAVMEMLTLPRKTIIKEGKERKLSMKQLRAVMKGEYYPVNFSKARFKGKIKDIESEAGRRGYDPSERFNKDDIYPKKEMREIINYLRRQDLNETFPFDITTDPEPKIPQDQIIQQDQKQSSIQTQPLENTPTPVVSNTNVAQINPQTGLTSTETALLSPDEQAIRIRQRT